MAKANTSMRRDGGALPVPTNEEDVGLLSGNAFEDEDIVLQVSEPDIDDPPKTPRTPNRVRFDLPPISDPDTSDGAPPSYDDSLDHHSNGIPLSSQHEPFLLGSQGSRGSLDSRRSSEDSVLRQLNRPKSSLRSAMSNMANSIIGAGIIGQPYALRQAGLLTGVILLVLLTITVDWTIRLIVINSKLSGRDSFQGTVEHCFGKVGLVAISLAQWAFAFGGMVAFGVIVGDSIPHVLEAVWPGLGDIPFLGLLTNRRVVIFIFIMAISWPLSLYRDIAKVCLSYTQRRQSIQRLKVC
jgi:solute carrier family 38 (sodium-coupled neutral amino acid transporter), member 11